jgi:methionine salvage enolase-phosphatase E1
MKSVNLDIWSTQTMSYEVSQLYDIVCVDQISKLTDFIGHCLCWSDIQVAWLHRTLFVLIRYPSINTNNVLWSQSTWISDQHKQCPIKSVNLDIWSTQTMSYEVSQLGYLMNTNNVLWSQSIWISDQHKQCSYDIVCIDQISKLTDFIGHFLCWSDIQVDWLHRTLFVLIRSQLGYLINTKHVIWSQSTWISDQHKQCPMKSVNLDIWSTQTMSYEVSQLGLCWSDIQVDWLHSTLFVLIRYPSWLTS